MDFVLGGRTDRGDLQARDGVDPDDFYSAMCYTSTSGVVREEPYPALPLTELLGRSCLLYTSSPLWAMMIPATVSISFSRAI